MLESIGYDTTVARWARRAAAAPDASVGRVIGLDRGVVHLLTRTGPLRATVGGALLGRMAGDATEGPCPGDWCLLRAWPDHRTTVERLRPRRTALVGVGVGTTEPGRPMCANVDLVAVVVERHPTPRPDDLERMVALAWESGGRPLVVLTTAGPVAELGEVGDGPAPVPGVSSVTVDVRSGGGVDDLRERLADGLTMALTGPSRPARTALTTALVGARPLAPGAARRASGSRRRSGHLSGRVELVPLPTGGAVLDAGDLGRADDEVPHPVQDIGGTRP